MRSFTSVDGVVLTYEVSGKGPPLVVVHGTTTDHTLWSAAAPLLEAHHTVMALDRRGRRRSGDGKGTYGIDQEADDVAALARSLGTPVALLGHSFGAVCALEGALRAPGAVRALVLYEPPFAMKPLPLPPDLVSGLEAQLQRGDREAVVTAFFRGVERVSDEDLAKLRALPSWSHRVEAAHTIPREVAAILGYRFDPGRFADLRIPTLLLLGGASPPFLAETTRTIAAALPQSRVQVLEGQRHSAMTSAPRPFADAVLGFTAQP